MMPGRANNSELSQPSVRALQDFQGLETDASDDNWKQIDRNKIEIKIMSQCSMNNECISCT